jgi:hemoglobin-like flavoprotein
MDERALEIFNDSLERCQADPAFLSRFYEIFISSDAAVAEKFARTDLKRQQLALKASLFMLLQASARNPPRETIAHLERIAERHDRRHLDIKPEMYDLWLDAMLQAVREFDRRYSAEVDRAWRQVLARGIELMQSTY